MTDYERGAIEMAAGECEEIRFSLAAGKLDLAASQVTGLRARLKRIARLASHVTHGKNDVPELPAVTDEDERIEQLRRDLIAIVRGGAK